MAEDRMIFPIGFDLEAAVKKKLLLTGMANMQTN